MGKWTLDPIKRRLRMTVKCRGTATARVDAAGGHAGKRGRILTKKFLLEKVWDIQFDPGTNVVDAMICRLRRKIDAPGAAIPPANRPRQRLCSQSCSLNACRPPGGWACC
jgi:DNA-binding response OmpR family regulator